jgi:hypothetical protein
VDEVDAPTEILSSDDGIYGSAAGVWASAAADLVVALQYGVYVFAGEFDGSNYEKFDSSYWSDARLSPDGTMVALQGYSTVNPAVSIFSPDGTLVRKISTNDAATSPGGLAWSPDSAWVASTRKDGSIEVTPVSGARGPTALADSSCAHPVWWDADTVALDCGGAIELAAMDGSGELLWLDNADVDDRVWAAASTDRVVYSTGAELHLSYIDLSDDTLLYAGSEGTTYSDVHFDGAEGWVIAVVNDPVAGTDVVAFPDLPPYEAAWLTSTPSEVEIAAGWVE